MKISQLHLLGKLNSLISCKRMVHLQAAVHLFDAFAPPQLAADWDNTGLLVEPPTEDNEAFDVEKIVVTNDLTKPVYDEARRQSASLVYAYHPLLFRPVKTFTPSTSWTVSVALQCIRYRMAVYCPHTAIDVIPDGNNDWLIDTFCSEYGIADRRPLQPADLKKIPVSTDGSKEYISVFKNTPSSWPKGTRVVQTTKLADYTLTTVIHKDSRLEVGDCQLIFSTVAPSASTSGVGRFVTLKKPIPSLEAAVELVKKRIGADRLRVVKAINSGEIKSIAVCAGSGSGVFASSGCSADLLLTGELSHHELLNAAASGSNVILTEHSRSERDFLKPWAVKMQEALRKLDPKVSVTVSENDADPVNIL